MALGGTVVVLMKCEMCGKATEQASGHFLFCGFGAMPRADMIHNKGLETACGAVEHAFIGKLVVGYEGIGTPIGHGRERHEVSIDQEHPGLPQPSLMPLQTEFVFCGFGCLRRWFSAIVDVLEASVGKTDWSDIRNPLLAGPGVIAFNDFEQ